MKELIGVTLATVLCATCLLADDVTSVAEFTKMRMDYTKRKDFDPGWESHDNREKITDLWDSRKIDEGMKLAKQWLEKHPVDAKMHSWYAYFLETKGDFQGYFRHKHFYQGLLASIASSGTGLSSDSPMKVISVSEEYTVLGALGAKLVQQSLIMNKAGVPCDKMECEMDGKKVTLYFDVTISMEHTRKMLTPKKETKKEPSNN